MTACVVDLCVQGDWIEDNIAADIIYSDYVLNPAPGQIYLLVVWLLNRDIFNFLFI